MHSQTIGRIMERTTRREAEGPKVRGVQQVVLRAIRQEGEQQLAVLIVGNEGIERSWLVLALNCKDQVAQNGDRRSSKCLIT